MGSYDELFEKKNVIGYEEQEDGLIVFVSTKQPEDELHPTDIVSSDLAKDVIDVQYGEERDAFEAQQHKGRHRPCVAGVSEMNERGTACTAGFLARVSDPSAPHTVSDDSLEEGDLVRAGNNHCLARVNSASIGETVIQPSPMDYGTQNDRVGRLVRYVPIEDGATVDIAARSASEDELRTIHNLDEEIPRGKNYNPRTGTRCTKSGRTTGVTEGEILATHATIRVNYGDATYTFDDQIVGDVPSQGGDSSSPVVTSEDGEMVGVLYAGSDEVSIWNRIENVESELGIDILTVEDVDEGDEIDEPDEDENDEGDEGDDTGEYLTFQEVDGLVTAETRRIADEIQTDSVDSMADLARKIDMSPGKVRYRLKKMEDVGIIEFEDGKGNSKIPRFTRRNIEIEPFN